MKGRGRRKPRPAHKAAPFSALDRIEAHFRRLVDRPGDVGDDVTPDECAHAGTVLVLFKVLREATDAGRTDEALNRACEIGLLARALVKDSPAAANEKYRQKQSASAQVRGVRIREATLEHDQNLKAAAARYRRKHPKASKRKMAETLGSELDRNPETIRSAMNRLKID